MNNNLETNQTEKNISETNLTENQKQSFENFMEQKKQTEKKQAFTTEERNALYKEFLEAQNQNSADILTGTNLEKNFGNRQNFEKFTSTIDSGVYKYFFGENGKFLNINIPEYQKKSFCSGVSIYLMDVFYSEIKKTGNIEQITTEIQKLFGGEGDLEQLSKAISGENEEKTIEIIKSIFSGDVAKILDQIYNEEKISLVTKIVNENKDSLTNNQIFTNPSETFEFFDKISKNNLTQNQIKQLLLAKNSDKLIIDGDQKKLKEVGNKIGEFVDPGLGNALGQISDITKTFENMGDKVKSFFTENETIMGFLATLANLPLIGGLIKSLLEGFDINIEAIQKENLEKFETVKTTILKKGSFFENYKLGNDFGTERNEIDFSFVNALKYISGSQKKEDFGEKLENLFKKESAFSQFLVNPKIAEIPGFENKTNLKTNKDEINYKNLKDLVFLYREYKKNKENFGNIDEYLDYKANEISKNSNQENTQQTETEIPTNPEQKTEAIPTKPKFENLTISDYQIDLAFENNGIWYKILLEKDGKINLTKFDQENIETKTFAGGENIFTELIKFKDKLNNQANSKDFGVEFLGMGKNLGQQTIKETLIEGYGKDNKGLKEIIGTNFLKNGNIKEENITINFAGKPYQFNFVA